MTRLRRASRRRRRVLGGAAALGALVVMVAVLAGAAALNSVAFVGGDAEGRVALYRGVPVRLPAGIELWRLDYRSGVPIASLSAGQRREVLEHDLRTPDEAAAVVRDIELFGLEG